jgi:hypothetical protein
MNQKPNPIEKLMLEIKDKMCETPSYIVKGVFAEVLMMANTINEIEKRRDHEKANEKPPTTVG